MTDAREIIAAKLPIPMKYAWAQELIDALHTAGIRFLGPDEVAALQRALAKAEEGAGTLPAKQSVKLRPADWHAIGDLIRALGRKP